LAKLALSKSTKDCLALLECFKTPYVPLIGFNGVFTMLVAAIGDISDILTIDWRPAAPNTTNQRLLGVPFIKFAD